MGWQVTIPFPTERGAKICAERVLDTLGYLGIVEPSLPLDDDGAGERIAETFDQAATDYARTEREA